MGSVPLCYVYPAMLHLKACAKTRRAKVIDWMLIIFGLIAAAYTTVQTVIVSRHSRFLVYALIECFIACIAARWGNPAWTLRVDMSS